MDITIDFDISSVQCLSKTHNIQMIWIFNTYYANFVRIDVICNLIILKTLCKYIESVVLNLLYLDVYI